MCVGVCVHVLVNTLKRGLKTWMHKLLDTIVTRNSDSKFKNRGRFSNFKKPFFFFCTALKSAQRTFYDITTYLQRKISISIINNGEIITKETKLLKRYSK